MKIFSSSANKNNIFNNITVFSFGLFPILPNNIKGLPVILLIVSALVDSVKNKSFKRDNKLKVSFFLIMASVYFFYLLSGIYSENVVIFGKKLETGLSLLLVPLAFLFNKNIISNKSINYFKVTFIISTIFFIVFFWSYNILYYTSSIFTLRTIDLRKIIDVIPLISLHPIYASMIFAIALFLLLGFWKKIKNYLFFSTLIILILNIVILASKMVIISLILFSLFFLIKNRKKYYHKAAILIAISFMSIAFIMFTPNLRQRFNEMLLPKTYKKVIVWNSTSIRNAIYRCSFELLENKWLIGYGIGDVQDNLNDCYEKTSNVLLDDNYNSHNQYLSILLGTGVLGLLSFVIMLWYNYKLAFNNYDMLFLSILFLFSLNFLTENLLERQSGVILFTFLINLFGWKNFAKTEMSGKISNKKLIT